MNLPIFKLETFRSSAKRETSKKLQQKRATIGGMKGETSPSLTSSFPTLEAQGEFSLATLFQVDAQELGTRVFSMEDYVESPSNSIPFLKAESPSRVSEGPSPISSKCMECRFTPIGKTREVRSSSSPDRLGKIN